MAGVCNGAVNGTLSTIAIIEPSVVVAPGGGAPGDVGMFSSNSRSPHATTGRTSASTRDFMYPPVPFFRLTLVSRTPDCKMGLARDGDIEGTRRNAAPCSDSRGNGRAVRKQCKEETPDGLVPGQEGKRDGP